MAVFKIKGNLKGNPKLKPLNLATGDIKQGVADTKNVPNDGDNKIFDQIPIPSIVNPPVDIPTMTPIGNTPVGQPTSDTPTKGSPTNTHHADNSKAGLTPSYDVHSPKATYPPTNGLEPFTRQPISVEQEKQVDNESKAGSYVNVNPRSEANTPDMVRSILNASPPGLEPLEQKPSVEKTENLPNQHDLNPVVSKTIVSKATASVLQPKQVANYTSPVQEPAKIETKDVVKASILPPKAKQVANFYQPVNNMNKPTVPFDQLQCTDGEVKTAESYKSAYEIAGFKNHDYNTSDISVYQSRLEKMNLGDLQAHAVEQGFLPTDNRPMLLERLLRKFRELTSPTRGMVLKKRTFDNIHSNPDKLAETLKILSKGR